MWTHIDCRPNVLLWKQPNVGVEIRPMRAPSSALVLEVDVLAADLELEHPEPIDLVGNPRVVLARGNGRTKAWRFHPRSAAGFARA
jgi:hypothetical protein